MPRSELTFIVQACHVQGFFVPSLEWIYEFVNIRPLWKADGVLMYAAHLPLTDNKEYLRYHLYTWPSVPKSANFTVLSMAFSLLAICKALSKNSA